VRRWLKRILPAPGTIRANRQLSLFGTLLHDPNLWHLNRRSVSGAVAIGLFVMFLPPFGQSLLAAGLAIVRRVNLPIAVVVSWISNPLTLPPMLYFAYRLGCWMLGVTPSNFDLEFWTHWRQWLEVIGPLLFGGLVSGLVAAVLGYLATQALWRWRLMVQIRRRRERYRALLSGTNRPSSSRKT
jgi:uncharacterized protein (DUF2062 family)